MRYTIVAGKKVSKIMLGTVQLGLDYGIANRTGRPSIESSMEILRAAVDNGITAFDTARTYGNSEDIIGSYLAKANGPLPFIVTKYKSNIPQGASYQAVEREVLHRFAIPYEN